VRPPAGVGGRATLRTERRREVRVLDSRMRESLDHWITTEPESDDVTCHVCESELGNPRWVKRRRETQSCDGKVRRFVGHYGDQPGDEGILRILGETFRGREYVAEYGACSEYDDPVDHEPHEIVVSKYESRTYVCGCGERTVITVS
jgi:hypothetical protein